MKIVFNFLSSTFNDIDLFKTPLLTRKVINSWKKRGLDLSLLNNVVDTLRQGKQLEAKYRDHELSGKFKGFRECHIKPDWLLVYLIENDILTLTLVDTGTHSDIFKL